MNSVEINEVNNIIDGLIAPHEIYTIKTSPYFKIDVELRTYYNGKKYGQRFSLPNPTSMKDWDLWISLCKQYTLRSLVAFRMLYFSNDKFGSSDVRGNFDAVSNMPA
jgi:hypothetical protein